jgi:CRISPR-associated protein Csb2
MPVYIEQHFPLGRFHATRWLQSGFADPYSEWPPSPWRLLRSLAARWFQYSRETGDRDPAIIERLLRALAGSPPTYYVPPYSCRGPALRQYQPTGEFAWSDPDFGSGAVKRSRTTIVPDPFFVVDPRDPVVWRWDSLDMTEPDRILLNELLRRITYFGRVESVSRLRAVSNAHEANCTPVASGGDAPVLCFQTESSLRLDALLAHSDGDLLGAASIPPGTEWVFYKRPPRPPMVLSAKPPVMCPVPHVQFSIGGHLYPPHDLWIKVAERFRGRVLKLFTGSGQQRELLCGKRLDGSILVGDHRHAYFLLWPDEEGNLSRLIVWRKDKEFEAAEVDAMMRAAEKPVPWTDDPKGWVAQMVPLPHSTPLPRLMREPSREWVSVTAFARPANRHSVRASGRKRHSEEPEQICATLIEKVWGIRPRSVVRIDENVQWVKLHESVAMRKARRLQGDRTPRVALGYRLCVTFDQAFNGPLIVGDSSHFGLGLFRASRPESAPDGRTSAVD